MVNQYSDGREHSLLEKRIRETPLIRQWLVLLVMATKRNLHIQNTSPEPLDLLVLCTLLVGRGLTILCHV